MSLDNFIPTVWAGSLLRALESNLVYAMLANTDYEGDIANAGDTVRINMIGDVTVFNVSKNTDIPSPEALTDAQLVLKVDQSKGFNFAIDDIDQAQQTPKVMAEAMTRSSYALRKTIDGYMASFYTEASAANQIGTDGSPITGTWTTEGTRAYDRLVDMGVLLDDQDVPEEDRFVVVPPWYEGYLLKDARFVSGGTPETLARLAAGRLDGQTPSGTNGYCGRAAGFNVYKSSQVPNTAGTKYKVLAGWRGAWSFASNVTQVEGYRPERRFADAVKGLTVYGGKVVRPQALAVMTANKT